MSDPGALHSENEFWIIFLKITIPTEYLKLFI